MSKAIKPDELNEIFRLYEIYGSYAEVARITGRSASAVRRYILMDKSPRVQGHVVRQTNKK